VNLRKSAARFRLLPREGSEGWTPFAWLIYLGFYVAYAFFGNRTPVDWAIDAAVLTAFLALYFRGFWVSGRQAVPIVVAIVALGVLMSPRNPGAGSFFIYAAAFAYRLGPSAVAFKWIAAIVLVVVIETVTIGLRPEAWIPAIVFSLIVGGVNVHFMEVRRKDRKLARAQEEVEHLAKIAERERIARDLHDLLGHTLSVIVLKSELASKIAERDLPRAVNEIRDVERISRNALTEVRQAISGFRGERLLDELATGREALEAAGVSVVTQIDPVGLGRDQERTLAFVLRESITNVIRHARAARCEIRLSRNGHGVVLAIADDGVGGAVQDGSGLSGMRARVAALGGTVERDGRAGTRVTVTLPT
jgi:two-component system, NarL family, sensor histidine kinase DesK